MKHLPLLVVLLLGAAAFANDDIVLEIVPDVEDDFYRLYWTGGQSPYEVYRSTDPAVVVLGTNRLGETVGQAWIDDPPLPGIHYYQVTSSCSPACVAGEICCEESCCSLPNATPACGGAGLGCVVQACDLNYWNRNGLHADGCEFFCDTPEISDFPDLSGTDENCDLVDGEVDNAIFVSKAGDDSNDGSLDFPKLTIQAGIDAAGAGGKRDVYVASGVYFEQVTVPSAVGVYGGYRDDFFARELTLHETLIIGPDTTPALPGAVNFLSVTGGMTGSSVVDGFTVFAPDAGVVGASSYGVYVLDSDDSVAITHNRIYGGFGADGARGSNGLDGPSGLSGAPGLDALDLYEAYGVEDHDCSAANHSAGGSGGTGNCAGAQTGGGDGGERVCPEFDGLETEPPVPSENGAAGQNGGGAGGAPGWDVYHQPFSCAGYFIYGDLIGTDGVDGLTGSVASGGAGCADPAGSASSGLWMASAAGGGALAGHGGGGGGGGSGAGAYMHASCNSQGYGYDNLGGSGGGGGAGGCGGEAGTGGDGGGGSFAVFVTYSTPAASVPEISGNAIVTGFGGAGGDGGHGGVGGAGGEGGSGGAAVPVDPSTPDPAFPSFAGGRGGDGGEGGHGGGGGGGCGGPAYGIYAWNSGAVDLTPWISGNGFFTSGSGGSGGLGGTSLGNPGGAGTSGTNDATNF